VAARTTKEHSSVSIQGGALPLSVRDDRHRRPQRPGDFPERVTIRRGRMAADDYTMLSNAFLADVRLSFRNGACSRC
jgi:hypothetical protein